MNEINTIPLDLLLKVNRTRRITMSEKQVGRERGVDEGKIIAK